MDRLRRLFEPTDSSYEPLEGGSENPDGEHIVAPEQKPFSWLDYSIFLFLGVAMLWAWNMFLAGAPYFQHRFESNKSLYATFQSTELSVSTVTNLGSMLILTKLQAGASYPKRILLSLVINIATFTLLTISTKAFLGISAEAYFGFFIATVLAASFAAALCQNGVFAYVSGFGREEYTQAIMTGQAVAGVLPCIVQIVSVLSVSPEKANEGGRKKSSTTAFIYFLSATFISAITVVATLSMLSRHGHRSNLKTHSTHQDYEEDRSSLKRASVPLLRLFQKLRWSAVALFLTFSATMFFPVFTQAIESVHSPETAPRILQKAAFIPLAFLMWNLGDLTGRLSTAIPAISLTSKPKILFILSLARIGFIPLYSLCNIRGHGATISSDIFYLVVVQFCFGLSNGYLGSSCMMGAIEWVDVNEREAAGGFMSLCCVGGLTAGSLLSFLVVV